MRLNLTIDRFENDKAVLKTDDNATIIWPKNKLPQDAHEGSILSFIINSDIKTEEEKKQIAKEVLNELLNAEDAK
ncbi:MAG: DUF3006 domain-containing protein [Patescibacteria group bacterium]|nr:DUF3006 domain-containing protein [Patescibacteria group bacterium]MDD4611193.1 DUF3006 domain-containing protein [Patescibacteria group bacterium]